MWADALRKNGAGFQPSLCLRFLMWGVDPGRFNDAPLALRFRWSSDDVWRIGPTERCFRLRD